MIVALALGYLMLLALALVFNACCAKVSTCRIRETNSETVEK